MAGSLIRNNKICLFTLISNFMLIDNIVAKPQLVDYYI